MRGRSENITLLSSVLDCSEEATMKIFRNTLLRTFARSVAIINQGDTCNRLFIVISGSVGVRVLAVDGQYTQICTIEAGEIFGGFPGAMYAKADMVARGPVQLVSIPSDTMARLSLEHADIGTGLARLFCRQFDNLMNRFVARVALTAMGRVYARLLEKMDDAGQVSPAPIVAALAVEAQTTRETASRAVSSLERRGILQRRAGGWVVLSPRLLEEMAI